MITQIGIGNVHLSTPWDVYTHRPRLHDPILSTMLTVPA